MPAKIDERARLEALYQYRLLDTPREAVFDQITSLIARSLDVPFATISLIDAERVWFKAVHGVTVPEVDREPGLCSTTIEGDVVRHIEDASVHPETRDNSLVQEGGIRFYVGAPLRTPSGQNIGTLCAFGPEPRSMTDVETELVERMAALVMREVTARHRRLSGEIPQKTGVLVVDDDRIMLTLLRRALEQFGMPVLTADLGRDARSAYADHRTEIAVVILSDSMMGRDAPEVVKDLRAEDPDVRVIVCSSQDEATTIAEFGGLTPNGFLRKPFGPAELMRVVNRVIAN